ncbi:hypothetical protein [Luteolibacter soli]|uniref:Uncharacterized protein n=1 Tax=Luteolibacter soli TaxID=3135280 RepID=A0ABU9AW77_9BACT
MKRRTAILLFGSLLLSMGGYVAWCFRPFYLPPRLFFTGQESPGARKALEEWRWSSNYAAPARFEWSMAWWNLRHPWQCKMGKSVAVQYAPHLGLAATDSVRAWGFSKTNGEWDASTVFDYGSWNDLANNNRSHRQQEIGTWIDDKLAAGATIEILSLGRVTAAGALVRPASEAKGPETDFPSIFHHYEVLGRVTVSDARERQRLFEGFARSVREGDVRNGLAAGGQSPGHGIVITLGGERAECLVSFEDGNGYFFGSGFNRFVGTYDDSNFGRNHPNENLAFFRLSTRYREAFDAVLDRNGIERRKLEK